MEKIYGLIWNALRFVTDQNYQWEQIWVRKLSKKCSLIHENIWTGIRVPGMLLVIWADQLFRNNWLTLGLFIFFGLTDWIDGKVVAAKGKKGTKFGSILDGVVDRIFIIPLIYYFGIYKAEIINPVIFWFLFLIEGVAYLVLWRIEKSNVIKDKASFYEHLNLGKYKFGIEIALGIMLWLASGFFSDWMWWSFLANLTAGTAIIFALFAFICKINKGLIVYLADALTLSNAVCGIIAISLVKTNVAYAAMLVSTGALIDFLDGYVAQKTKLGKTGNARLGAILDSLADFITFGLAPAVIAWSLGVHLIIVSLYVTATLIRLIRYTLGKDKQVTQTVSWDPGSTRPIEEFDGYPSTAAGIVVANLAWCGISLEYLSLSVLLLAIFEVSFMFKWYHFKNYYRLKREVKVVPALMMAVFLILERFSLGIVISMIIYTSIFFKPISTPFFSWSK